MKNNQTSQYMDHHCSVREQKHLVSEMSRCDQTSPDHDTRYECYLNATRESRESNACMYS